MVSVLKKLALFGLAFVSTVCFAVGFSVNDSGTWRSIRIIYVNDGGTWRPIKRAYINDAGTWRKVYGLIHTFSGTAATFLYDPFNGYTQTGYMEGISTLSPTALPDSGKNIGSLFDDDSFNNGQLIINGFSSDPGISYVTSVTINSTTKTTATASYNYNSSFGVATWTWSSFQFGFAHNTAYTGNITY